MLPLQCRPCRALQLYGDLCLQAEAETKKVLYCMFKFIIIAKNNPEIGPDSTRNLMFSCFQVLQVWWTEIDYRALTRCECHTERISCCVRMRFAAPQNKTPMQVKKLMQRTAADRVDLHAVLARPNCAGGDMERW